MMGRTQRKRKRRRNFRVLPGELGLLPPLGERRERGNPSPGSRPAMMIKTMICTIGNISSIVERTSKGVMNLTPCSQKRGTRWLTTTTTRVPPTSLEERKTTIEYVPLAHRMLECAGWKSARYLRKECPTCVLKRHTFPPLPISLA